MNKFQKAIRAGPKWLALLMLVISSFTTEAQVGFPRDQLISRCDSFEVYQDYGNVVYTQFKNGTACLFNFNEQDICFYTTVFATSEDEMVAIKLVTLFKPWNQLKHCSVHQSFKSGYSVFILKN